MAIITTDKVVLIVVVTAIVIVLAYVFPSGHYSDRSKREQIPPGVSRALLTPTRAVLRRAT